MLLVVHVWPPSWLDPTAMAPSQESALYMAPPASKPTSQSPPSNVAVRGSVNSVSICKSFHVVPLSSER